MISLPRQTLDDATHRLYEYITENRIPEGYPTTTTAAQLQRELNQAEADYAAYRQAVAAGPTAQL